MWMRSLSATTVLLVVAATAASCMDSRWGALGAAACPQLASQQDLSQATISANARANVKIRAFVTATRDLVNISLQMENEAVEACRRMARDLGLGEA